MKHPVDELFQKKLNTYEIQASEEAKKKFLLALEHAPRQSKRPIWIFSAAASVLLIGLASWLLMPSISNKNNTDLAHSQLTKSTEENTIALDNSSSEIADSDKNNEPATQKNTVITNNEKSFIQKVTNPKTELAHAASISKKYEGEKKLTGVSEIDEPIIDNLTAALQNSEKKKKIALLASKELAEANNLFQKSVGETIIIVASDIPDEEIYIPGLNPDSNMTLAEAKDLGESLIEEERSFMAKVFTELKHLKHGEKVNINAIVASNDESFINNEDGFIGYEAMQFKQRFRKIKNTITKQ